MNSIEVAIWVLENLYVQGDYQLSWDNVKKKLVIKPVR